MKIYEIQERDPQILAELLKVWEASVRETHLFLSEEEVNKIKTYVPQALSGVEHLIVAREESGETAGFMGVEKKRLEMLFLSPEVRGKGLGRQLLQYGTANYDVQELTVNEQNPGAVGFYKRTDHDEEGNPYPLLYMKRHGN